MKDKASNITRQIALSLIIFLTGSTNVFAAPGKIFISQTPLFLGAGVQPNIFFVSDDSGSMDWETMMGQSWRYDAYDPDQYREGHFHSTFAVPLSGGTWRAAEFKGISMSGGYGYIYGRTVANNAEDNVYGLNCKHSYRSVAEECGGGGISPLDVDWRVLASGLNKIFFNADIQYKPWSGPCGYGDCANADYNNVRSNPYNSSTGYNYVRDMDTDGDARGGAFVYEVWVDDSGYTGSRPRTGVNFNETGYAASGLETGSAALDHDAGNGLVDLWDSHMRFTVGAGNNVTVQLIAYNPNPNSGDIVNRGLNETVVFESTLSSTSACYNVLGNKGMVRNIRNEITSDLSNASSYMANTGLADSGCRTIAEVRQNVANWFQYYRRRAFPVKNAIAAVIDAQPTFRYGMTLLNENTVSSPNDIFIPVPEENASITLHNEKIKRAYFEYRQESNSTPLRRALKLAGDYYMGNSGRTSVMPIIESCQKNFTILFTDGYWNGGTNPSGIGDADKDGAFNGNPTVADVAYHFYMEDLMPGMADNVSIDKGEEDLKFGDPDKTKTFQHMVTFTVAFGVNGNLSDLDGDESPDFRSSGVEWTTPGEPTKDGDGALGWGDAGNGPEKIDDLWHAAFNSSGTYASASTPDDIINKLISAISNIEKRQSSAAAVALNSGTLNANSRVYQASFNSSNWSGSIKSIPIQDGFVDENPQDNIDDSPSECDNYPTLGKLCIDFSKNEDGEWNAEKILETRTYNSRKTYTYSFEKNAGIVFDDIANLDAAQQLALRTHPDTANVELLEVGQSRLDFIRGDKSNEGTGTANFRKRKTLTGSDSSKLGDIVHSAPAFVGKPDFFYPDKLESDSYNAYKSAQKNRKGVVYVGANDGMLHAFDASNDSSKGSEIFAYAPGALIKKLPRLTSQTYNSNHAFFVDGSPITFDAYKGGWRTLLANSAGAGAQLVFGLDITNPQTFGVSDIKWEFTDNPREVGGVFFGDEDLGYTIGDVSYARLNNGKWVVIFGNGFNNTEPDDYPSSTGNGVIYIVDAFTGELINKMDTGVGMLEDPAGASRPNGISRVTPVDLDGDFKADALYAGDLFGNVWEVDISDSNPDSWKFAKTEGLKPVPFYVAKDENGDIQPITTAVAVKRHPEEVKDTLVLFGTGSYFQLNDATTSQKQTFYAIWNDGHTGASYLRSDLLMQKIEGVQVSAGNEFRITSSADTKPEQYQVDWTKDKGWYIDLDEVRERVNVEPILRGNRVIFVTMTPDIDPCKYGGTSWIMELNSNNGSRLKQSPFDVDGNGIIDDKDHLSFAGDAATITSGVRAKGGIVASPGILNTRSDGVNTKELKFLSGTSGKIETIDESVDSSQRDRQSWRQLR